MKGKKIVSYALATIMTMQGGGLVFANEKIISNSKSEVASNFKITKSELLQDEINKLNSRLDLNLSLVSDFNYENLSDKQINNIINTLNSINIEKNNNDIKMNICNKSNSSVYLPVETIAVIPLPQKLFGVVDYTAENNKFASIDNVKTWVEGNEFLIEYTWTQNHYESYIQDEGKTAYINVDGTLRGYLLIEGAPLHIDTHVDKMYSLKF